MANEVFEVIERLCDGKREVRIDTDGSLQVNRPFLMETVEGGKALGGGRLGVHESLSGQGLCLAQIGLAFYAVTRPSENGSEAV